VGIWLRGGEEDDFHLLDGLQAHGNSLAISHPSGMAILAMANTGKMPVPPPSFLGSPDGALHRFTLLGYYMSHLLSRKKSLRNKSPVSRVRPSVNKSACQPTGDSVVPTAQEGVNYSIEA